MRRRPSALSRLPLRARFWITLLAVAVLAVASLVRQHPWRHDEAPISDSEAAAALETLPIKARAPQTGYSRARYGKAWTDVDGNGCDTRDDVLARDLTDVSYRNGHCKVRAGTLHDPYTGRIIHFVAGPKTSEAVQIDHVVALSDAWRTGAQQLDARRREELANDPLNLLAVDGAANSTKSDGDAATWLPENASFRCSYVSKQIQVKKKYGLWVTGPEHDAMRRVLATC